MGLVLNERYFLALFRFNTNLYLRGQKNLKKKPKNPKNMKKKLKKIKKNSYYPKFPLSKY